MARTYRSRALAVLRDNETAMAGLFNNLATQAMGEVMRRADGDGRIPVNAIQPIQAAIGRRVTGLFIGVGREGAAPLEERNGRVVPLSPYTRQLYTALEAGMRVPVEQHADILRRRLPGDIRERMQEARGDPFARARQVQEQIFRPNPLAQYDPPHTWVDPNGYRLSDRIWQAERNTRRRLDLLVDDAVRSGRAARDLAGDLETFLLPGRQLKRTNKPYGTDASYDAMRLARTEITRGAARAAEASAGMNPFVRAMQWNLSPRHRCCDECDDLAAGGEAGDGVYPLDNLPVLPAHPHCLCYWTQVLIAQAEQQAILDELRAEILRSRQQLVDLVGPLRVDLFTKALLNGQTGFGGAAAPAAAAATPAVAPAAPAYDLSEGTIVRERITAEVEDLRDEVRQLEEAYAAARTERSRLARGDVRPGEIAGSRLDAVDQASRNVQTLREQLEAARARVRERVRAGLRLPTDRRSSITLRESSGFKGRRGVVDLRGRMQEATGFVNDVTDGMGTLIFADRNRTGRAYAYKDDISVSVKSRTATIVHEIGHVIEYERGAEFRAKRMAFFNARTEGDTLTRLSEINPRAGYRDNERTLRDRWEHPYTGKVYDFDSDENSASEVISMGIESLYEDPIGFFRADPEYADFIIAYLRGSL